jgi:hypothetical protein
MDSDPDDDDVWASFNWETVLPGLADRGRLTMSNPVAIAETFMTMLKAFFEGLLGFKECSSTRKTVFATGAASGIFGRCFAAYAVIEVHVIIAVCCALLLVRWL